MVVVNRVIARQFVGYMTFPGDRKKISSLWEGGCSGDPNGKPVRGP